MSDCSTREQQLDALMAALLEVVRVKFAYEFEGCDQERVDRAGTELRRELAKLI